MTLVGDANHRIATASAAFLSVMDRIVPAIERCAQAFDAAGLALSRPASLPFTVTRKRVRQWQHRPRVRPRAFSRALWFRSRRSERRTALERWTRAALVEYVATLDSSTPPV